MKESRLHQVLTAIIDILWLGLLWLLCSLPLVTLGAASTALYYSMILLYCAIGIPMSTFLIRGLMDSIPMELEEAAYIDGSGFCGRFFHIILPLSRTGIVTAATFEFLTCWNEFVFANLIVSSEKLRTIQVGIHYFTNQFSTDYVSMYAAIVISIVPSIIGYVLFQEQIIAGMTSGAVKG